MGDQGEARVAEGEREAARRAEIVRRSVTQPRGTGGQQAVPGQVLALEALRFGWRPEDVGAGGASDAPWVPVWATGRGADERLVRVLRCVVDGRLGVWDGRPVVLDLDGRGDLRVRDAVTGERRAGFAAGGGTRLVAAVPDGKRLLALTGREEAADGAGLPGRRESAGTLRLRDVVDGTPVGVPFGPDKGLAMVAAGVVVDGRPAVVCDDRDGLLRVWDPATGCEIGDPYAGHAPDGPASLAVAERDGRTVVVSVGRWTGDVRVWDPATGREIADDGLTGPVREGPPGKAGRIDALCVRRYRGRTYIAFGGLARTVRWRALDDAGENSVPEPFVGLEQPVVYVEFGVADGQPAVVGLAFDGEVRVWRPERRRHGGAMDGPATARRVRATARVAGRWLVVGDDPDCGETGAWNPADPQAAVMALTRHRGGVAAMATLTETGRTLLVTAGHEDRLIRITDLATATPAYPPIDCGAEQPQCLATAVLDGRPAVLVGSAEGTVRVWEPATGRQLRPALKPPREDAVPRRITALAATASSDNGPTVVLIARSDHTVRRWDLNHWQPLGGPMRGHRRAVSRIVPVRCGDDVLAVTAAAFDPQLWVWDVTTGRARDMPLRGHRGLITGLAVTRLGGRPVAVSGGHDGTVRTWDVRQMTELGEPLRFPHRVGSLAALGEEGLIVGFGDDLTLLRPAERAPGSDGPSSAG
ncbi:hypothetical protein ACIRU5_19040 [Streptomyces misionensis]|uniref:hypothetical protein n=1 Tax=Streptomyces misionensis TaxID=67331 RepID=UPI00382B70F4